jgi:hypothetical protein
VIILDETERGINIKCVAIMKKNSPKLSVTREVFGEDDGVTSRTFHKITSRDASRSGRLVWRGVYFPLQIAMKCTTISLVRYYFESSFLI